MAESIEARVDRLELPFNEYGVDHYGISKKHLVTGFKVFSWLYRHYFAVRAVGAQNIPPRGRAMVVGNHSGGYAIDGAMTIAACFLELEQPRLAQGMAEKFINRFPIASIWASRTGQFTGLPEHAERLLNDDRLLMVFPEGARGTAKLFPERYSLVDFGTGFVRLAMRTKTPIVPFGFVGGADAVPTIANLYALAKPFGVPYLPLTPYLLPLPRPVRCEVHFGAPIVFEGTGNEDDEVIGKHVARVKDAIAELVAAGRKARRGRFLPGGRR